MESEWQLVLTESHLLVSICLTVLFLLNVVTILRHFPDMLM